MNNENLWRYVAESLEMAATDLEAGDIENAAYQLRKASETIFEEIER